MGANDDANVPTRSKRCSNQHGHNVDSMQTTGCLLRKIVIIGITVSYTLEEFLGYQMLGWWRIHVQRCTIELDRGMGQREHSYAGFDASKRPSSTGLFVNREGKGEKEK